MQEIDLFLFYQNKFKQIYADLVAIEGKKSLEIDTQIEAAMSHLALGKTSNDINVAQSNIDSAYAHVGRACLDAAKLLWLNCRGEVEKIMKDGMKREWCSTVSEGTLLEMYNSANNGARAARRKDSLVGGHASEELVDLYHGAAAAHQNILDTMDWGKLNSIDQFRWWYILKQQTAGFILGIVAGLISSAVIAVLSWKYLPPSPASAEPAAASVRK